MDKKKFLTLSLFLIGGIVAFKIYNKFRRDKIFRESIDNITEENPEITE